MATTVDELLVRVELDLKDIRTQMAKMEGVVDKGTKRVGNSFSSLGRSIKGFAAAYATYLSTQGVIATAKFGSGIEEMQAKSEQVFKQFLPTVRAELESFGEAAGRSRFDLEEMAASVQDLFVPLGMARGEAARMSVDLTKLATDVASFNNQADVEVLNNFRSGLVGNHEVLYRYGVVINDAFLKAELFRMGIRQNIDEVDGATKAQARYNLIVAGTADSQGDAIRTASSLANQTRAMKAEWQAVWYMLSNLVQPIFLKIVTGLKDAGKAVRNFKVELTELALTRMKEQNWFGRFDEDIAVFEKELVRLRQEAAKTDEVVSAISLSGGDSVPQTDPMLQKQANLIKDNANEMYILEQRLGGATDAEIAFIEANIKLGRSFGDQTMNLYQSTQALAELEAQQKNHEATLNAYTGAIEGLGQGLSDSLAQAFMSGKLAMDDFKNVARSFVSELISQFIRLAIINQLLNSIFGLTGQNALPVANFGGGAKANNATGGKMQRGIPTLVGERGPEIIIPDSTASVVNSNNTRSALAGGGQAVNVHQTINVSTGVAQTVRAEVLQLLPVIQQQTISAVASAKQRGGGIGKQL